MSNDGLDEARVVFALAQAMPSLAPASDVRTQLFSRLRSSERYTLFGGELASALGMTADAAREALRMIDDARVWQPGDSAGSRMFANDALRERGAIIVDLPEQTSFAKHAHREREITIVLDGLLIENGSAERRPGDVIDMPIGSEHSIAVAPGHHCLVVFARR